MSRLKAFQRIFRLPPEMVPYLDLVATDQEIDLIVGLGERSLTQGQIGEMLSLGGAETEQLLLTAKTRAIVERQTADGVTTYLAGNAYRRLTYLSMQDYDRWCAVPPAVREKLLVWHLQENILHHDLECKLDLLKQDPDAVTIHNRDILLLDEALQIVDAAELHVVVPCDCRTTVLECDHARWDTCFRLDDRGRRTLEQGEGRIITKRQCREILLDAHRAGLIQTGQRAENGRPAILNGNCCACCSYPIRAGVALGMARQWPKSHYVADRNLNQCEHCGTCVARCPFGAFFFETGAPATRGKAQRMVAFEPEHCFGCGVCASSCAQHAIKMLPLHGRAELNA